MSMMGFGHRNISIIVIVGVFGFLLGSFGIISSNTDTSLQTDSVFAVGHLQLILKDADGSITQYIQTDNLILDSGFNTMADLVFSGIDFNTGGLDQQFNILALGNSSQTETEGDTGLIETHIDCPGTIATITGNPSSGGSGTLVILNVTFNGSDGCTGTFLEAVIQNDLTDGEALSRQVFSPITLEDNDSLGVEWIIGLG